MLLIIIIALCFFLYQAQGILYEKYWEKGLDVKISFEQEHCVEGSQNVLVETIVNNKKLPLPLLHVKFNTPKSFLFQNEDNSSVTDYYYRDDVFSITGHQSITRKLTFTSGKRGCFYMNDTNLVANDLFLQKTFNTNLSNASILHVYPAKVDVSLFDIPFNTITGSFATQKNLVEDPFEFRGIREYQPYDSIHSINWKSTARTNKLQVNTFFMTSSQEVCILLNLDTHIYTKNEKLVETSIRIASSLAERFIHAGIPVSLESNGIDLFTGNRIYQPAGQGEAHMAAIDNSLSRIDTALDNADFLTVIKNVFKEGNKNSYYIFISNSRHDDLADYYMSLKEQGICCYFIIPEYASCETGDLKEDMIKWEVQ